MSGVFPTRTPAERTALIEAALDFLPQHMDSPQARVMLIAIGLQESRLKHRYQLVAGKPKAKGPARGLWQFERMGGTAGVLTHSASFRLALATVESANLTAFDPRTVWTHLEHDDLLAARFARLLLWTDPRALPARGDAQGGWDCYIRNWRPGKPHRDTWDAFWAEAEDIVYGAA